MVVRPALVVLPAAAVPGAAAAFIADTLRGAVEARGIAHWATTGGSSAPAIYRALAALSGEEAVPWDRVHTWWGDDRFVRHTDPLSNVLPINGTGIPAGNQHPIPTDEAIAAGAGPARAAERYVAELADALPSDVDGLPVFDLVILGVGPDGHILSVFPGSAAWDAEASVVAVPAPAHIEPHVDRVTLNPRVVGAARAVLVTTAGASKAANLARAWSGHAEPRDVPVAATLLPTATWLLDETAAAELPGN